MRDVASKLGVTDAALYHHFPGRDALLAAMVDALAERFELPRAAADWRRFLRSFADRLRASVLAVPGSAEVLATLGPATPGTRRIVETVVERLLDSGFDVDSAALAYSIVTTYVVTSAARQEGNADIGSFASALWAGRGGSPLAAPSPLFASVLAAWRSRSWDQHYAYGIEALLDGIASRRSRGSKRRTRGRAGA
ncbi:Tetracycline repressor protein class A from transposon 1721 [Myxococcaceae bacterium]|nr:Tetracycline repressor protein class A from transposon 1721 [Myxococcaceae bacterium]